MAFWDKAMELVGQRACAPFPVCLRDNGRKKKGRSLVTGPECSRRFRLPDFMTFGT